MVIFHEIWDSIRSLYIQTLTNLGLGPLPSISTILASRQFQESEAVLSSGGNCLPTAATWQTRKLLEVSPTGGFQAVPETPRQREVLQLMEHPPVGFFLHQKRLAETVVNLVPLCSIESISMSSCPGLRDWRSSSSKGIGFPLGYKWIVQKQIALARWTSLNMTNRTSPWCASSHTSWNVSCITYMYSMYVHKYQYNIIQ